MKNRKTLFLLAAMTCFLGLAYAQEEVPERPTDVGVSDFDEFKNTSFDVMEQSANLNEDVSQVDQEIKQYSGMMNQVQIDKLKKDYAALTGIRKETDKLNASIGQLDEKGKDLLANAKNVTPKTKSPKATSNTNKSIKGLEVAKGNLKTVSSLLEEDTKLLSDELKSRGELIE